LTIPGISGITGIEAYAKEALMTNSEKVVRIRESVGAAETVDDRASQTLGHLWAVVECARVAIAAAQETLSELEAALAARGADPPRKANCVPIQKISKHRRQGQRRKVIA
jgi:hypothetical protein